MKKTVFTVICVVVTALSFALPACAEGYSLDEDYYSEAMQSIIDSETAERLEDFGLDDFSVQEIYSISFDEIGEYFSTELRTKVKQASGVFFKMLCVVVIALTLKAFFSECTDGSINVISVITVIFLSVDILGDVLNALLSSMKTGGDFMLAFIPIYTVILSLCGNVSSAVAYNTVTFAFAQGISAFINNFAVDFIGAYFAISVALSMNKAMNLNRFVSAVNRFSATVLGFLASGFTAFLSVRGVLSVAVDSAASRSIKFLVSNLIPIVGSSISDAYSSVVGSINVIKGSVAIVGIIVILIISVPPIIEGAVYCIGFSVMSYISELADSGEITSTLKAFSSGVRTVILLNIFQCFILIVSTGIMLTAKGAS